MPKGNTPMTTLSGIPYTSVRKVIWDGLWHLCYEKDGELAGWTRVDRATALRVAARLWRNHKK